MTPDVRAAVESLPREALEPERKSQAQRLIELVPDEAVFRATDGETAFATVPVGDHRETWPIRAKGFRRWLVGMFYQTEKKPPSAQALADSLVVLEARAQFGRRVHDVHVRLAGAAEVIYLDLGNAKWEAVEVTPAGWRVVAEPPVKFRRAKGMLPLPHPVGGGKLTDLRRFVNLRDDGQWALLVAWALAALRPSGPYPVLNLTSEHGSGKTTIGEVLRRLIDPNSAMLRAEPRDVRDVMIAATNSWLVAFDNLSALQPWLSDCLCRLSTGGGFSTRELYSDADEMIFSAQRPALLNGIEEIVTRGDLLDRSLLLDLPPIPEARRMPAGEFWLEFDAARPHLLGSLLDAVSTALRRVHLVRLDRLPRMADFAVWATAAAPALGWKDDYFTLKYASNREQAHDLALDASPVADVIRALSERGEWSGTSTEMLEVLNGLASEATRRSKSWPTTARLLGAALRRITPNLRAVGITVDFTDRRELGPRRRQITITAAQQKVDPNHRSHRSHRSYAGSDGAPSFPGNDGPLPGNAGSARRNERNDGNDEIPPLSSDDRGRPMTPADLVAALRARWVVLWPDGENLRIRPVSKVSPDELQALRDAKAEVLRLVTNEPLDEPVNDRAGAAAEEITPEAEARALLDRMLAQGVAFEVIREGDADYVIWFGSAATVADEVRAEVARLKPEIIAQFRSGHPRSRRAWGNP